jgi:hypothetical protein
MPMPDPRSSAGLRFLADRAIKIASPIEAQAAHDLSKIMTWAADELDRLNAIIAADSHKTFLIDSDGAKDYRVRNRVWGILAWHVNRQHADLTDRDLALAAFREYEKHWGCALIDPNE